MQTGKIDKEASKKELNWFKRHKILTVLLVLFLIGIISSLNKQPEAKTASTAAAPSPVATAKPAAKEIPKIGTAVRDGKFEFTVTSVECGKPNVGTSQYSMKTAQGQYCLLALTVKNIGDKPQTLFSTNQKLFNAAGQEYSSDDTATLYNSPNMSSVWLTEINPGNSVEGTIVFDLPKDSAPVSAELHDSAVSGGVKVSLQ